jgi:endonuclease G
MTNGDRPPPGLRFAPEPADGAMARVVKTLRDPSLYDDRDDQGGFDESFLGVTLTRPTLSPTRAKDAVKRLHGKGNVLNYWNFSTVQSRSRRMPFYSACNVHGKRSVRSSRSDVWHYDPRIDKRHQLIDECYGTDRDGFFSRGHMTKREDPVWGPHKTEAEDDTFHATNQVPQMQGHNGGLWKSLEDYILKNARKSKQRACVMTGPIFSTRDPVIHGVQVPVVLWKIVAFIHDDTKDLAAVAYRSSQADFLPDVGTGSFLWGQFKRMQVTVESIAKATGLSFGSLGEKDVLRGADTSFAMALTRDDDLILG